MSGENFAMMSSRICKVLASPKIMCKFKKKVERKSMEQQSVSIANGD